MKNITNFFEAYVENQLKKDLKKYKYTDDQINLFLEMQTRNIGGKKTNEILSWSIEILILGIILLMVLLP